MGFFDKAKRLLGLDPSVEGEPAEAPPAKAARDERPAPPRGRGKDRKDRPPLAEPPADHGQSIEDALAAREEGDAAGARKIFATIDKGGGLRTVLRAAAALEDGDEGELRELLPAIKAEAEQWKLHLQLAAALGDPEEAEAHVRAAEAMDAPAWALAWTRAASSDEKTRREGLVELLFTDAPLARTVAARDLGATGVLSDAEAGTRYAAFAHGRDSIKRFGAPAVAKLVQRAERS